MGRFVRMGGVLAVCLLFFSPSLPADGVHSFTDHAGSFSDSHINFITTDPPSVRSDSAFFVSRTFGSNEDYIKWLDDSKDDHGKAWGRREEDHHHRHHDNGGWKLGDQDNQDTDGDSGNAGSTGSGDPSTPSVPEPSVLVLLSAALAAFLLKYLRSATA